MARKPKGPVTLYDKVNKLDPAFAAEVYSFTDDLLKQRLVDLTKTEEELSDAKEKDPDLAEARERLKTANESYREPLKASKLKKKLILQVMSERGKA